MEQVSVTKYKCYLYQVTTSFCNTADFPNWHTLYTYFRKERKDKTWVKIHDQLREWVRLDHEPEASPSSAIIDSQSVKSAAMVSKQVGFDAGKLIKGRKRFLSVDTSGLVLRVFVTAASLGEREGGFPSA